LKPDKEYFRQYYINNRERVLEKSKQWYAKNKEKKAAYDKQRRELLGDELRQYDKDRKQLAHRKAAHRNYTRKRRMHLQQATPSWLDEFDLFHVQEIYDLAVRRSLAWGIELHVDHEIPLKGKRVCGLHVPSNLRIIDAKSNIIKGNQYGNETHGP
jgi:hypothetical protein